MYVYTIYCDVDMVCPVFAYPYRRIYCDFGYIFLCFLDMDIEAKEVECAVSYSVDCPLCIINSYVLEVESALL